MPFNNRTFHCLQVLCILLIITASCTSAPSPTLLPAQTVESTQSLATPVAPTPTPQPPKVLTICMGREPDSLFLYGDSSLVARSVREAIHDGPMDIRSFEPVPVILEKIPSQASGDAFFEAVEVQPGDLIVDSTGTLTNLDQGVSYLPAGCEGAACALAYSGPDPVTMDRLVVRYTLRPGLQWSDGSSLSADDSVYSYEVAKSLYPRARADLIAHTQAYQVVDGSTVEWRGVPGYRDPRYAANFFTPLPRHAWGSIAPEELLAAEISSRWPIGWGPYQIDEWTAGDHITLSRNPAYFRAAEGLPHFDKLVIRFGANGQAALDALLAGECDYIDESTALEAQTPQLLQLQEEGRLSAAFAPGAAWEHADFGILSANPDRPRFFQLKETRQAVAMCIDRQSMAEELFFGQSLAPDTYVPPDHPLANPQARHYDFDPQAASQLLQSVGWVDADGDPATPRIAQGVPGVPDGTAFAFTYLTSDEAEKQRAAQIVKDSLAQCGMQANVETMTWNELLAPGPAGPLFGRNFDMTQYAWITSLEPPCFLYTSAEIPAPYPQSPKGWGGANASGYSSPDFDGACRKAISSLKSSPDYQEAHRQAQVIFAEELPALPLYLRLKLVVTRPDMCNVMVDPSSDSTLWNLEAMDYGQGCE